MAHKARLILDPDGRILEQEIHDQRLARIDAVLDACGLRGPSFDVLVRTLDVIGEVTGLPVLFMPPKGAAAPLQLDARKVERGIEVYIRAGHEREENHAELLAGQWWPRAVVEAADAANLGIALNVWDGSAWVLDWINDAGQRILGTEQPPTTFPPHASSWSKDDWNPEGSAWEGKIDWTTANGERRILETGATHETHYGQHSLVVLFRDITRQEAAEVEMRRALALVQQSNRDLEDLANVLAHDLREPLVSIVSALDLIEQDDELLVVARTAAARLDEMLRGLLQVARVSGDGERGPVDLNRVVHEVKVMLQAAIKGARAEVVVETLPIVRGHPTRLQQLFQNLIQNALHHAGDGVLIEIHQEELPEEWIITVRDNGTGFQGDPEDSFLLYRTTGKGLGLGLSLCRRIVDAHGGRIWAENDGGAVFRFTLPK